MISGMARRACLSDAGVHPRIAQELLRHASSKTTMEIYSRGSAAQQRDAADGLQRAAG